MSVKQTLDTLDTLQAIGFDDDAFWRLHHFRECGAKETIARYRGYCKKQFAQGAEFNPGGTNEMVSRRLAFVLETYSRLGLSPKQNQAFNALSEAAYFGIPPR